MSDEAVTTTPDLHPADEAPGTLPLAAPEPPPTAEMKSAIRKLSFKQRNEIYERLKTLLQAAGNSLWVYLDGWTDVSVAASMGFECGASSIAYVRNEMFGPLRRSGAADPIAERLDRLEAALRKLLSDQGRDPAQYGLS